jgi:hypothetical protein
MVAGTELTRTTNDTMELLQTSREFKQLVVANAGNFWPKAATQDVSGRFGQLHAQCRRGCDVFALVTGIGLGDKQIFALEQFDLAADAGFCLT